MWGLVGTNTISRVHIILGECEFEQVNLAYQFNKDKRLHYTTFIIVKQGMINFFMSINSWTGL